MTPRFKTDATGAIVPDVRAAAAIIFNPVTGQILYEENSQDKRSIASITKVMTALVFLEDNPDLTSDITIERSDVYAASTTYLRGQRSHHASISCCTCCSSPPTTAPRVRSRGRRTVARRSSSSG